ncbi:hypothetical protein HMPREF1982_04187 [Clostridiales bacterium oral taxon 876 str. F0540]|nr:hypothetical protein HMPREF1982_04187 [Clostridiales bacterium oral taxon 876 str. F0540]
MTKKKLTEEIKYQMARNFLSSLLEQKKITPQEYKKAEEYAAGKYHPLLRTI